MIYTNFLGIENNFCKANRENEVGILENKLDLPVKVLKQTHSTEIVVVETPNQTTDTVEADCLITTLDNVAIGVYTADCIPILLEAPNLIAAIHLGRKGLNNGLLQKVVKLLKTDFSINPRDIKCNLGPALEFENHTTWGTETENVPDKFKYFYPLGVHYFNNIPIVSNWLKANSLDLDALSKMQSVRFDYVGFTIQLLLDLGLKEENIISSRTDTFANSSFHSYRRDYPNHGMNFSYIYKSN